VENAGQQDVYDLSMHEGVEPAFVANGVVVHNTLLWRLLDLADGPDKAEIIDLTGLGRSHLEEKLIQTPLDPDRTFSDDPTRMLRAIKFLVKYGLKISPEVAASMRRNAPKLKNMPWEAVGKILVGDILSTSSARGALVTMASFGLIDVLAEMIREQKPFAAYMAGQFNASPNVGLLLDMADLGLGSRPIEFLTPVQQTRLREVTTGMPEDEAAIYLATLRKPPVDNETLISEFNLMGRDRSAPVTIAREALLLDPKLVNRLDQLEARVRGGLSARSPALAYRLTDR